MSRMVLWFVIALATGCSNGAAPPGGAGNVLEMTLDGKPWKADREWFGAVDPPGFAHALLMSGSFGPKNENEQVFNLNVAGVDKPGRYVMRSSEASAGNAAQMVNLTPQRYLAGGVLGFDVTVDVTVVQKNPARIDAHFAGTLTANDSGTIVVTDGRFRYSE